MIFVSALFLGVLLLEGLCLYFYTALARRYIRLYKNFRLLSGLKLFLISIIILFSLISIALISLSCISMLSGEDSTPLYYIAVLTVLIMVPLTIGGCFLYFYKIFFNVVKKQSIRFFKSLGVSSAIVFISIFVLLTVYRLDDYYNKMNPKLPYSREADYEAQRQDKEKELDQLREKALRDWKKYMKERYGYNPVPDAEKQQTIADY